MMMSINYETSRDAIFCSLLTLPFAYVQISFLQKPVLCSFLNPSLYLSSRLKAKNLDRPICCKLCFNYNAPERLLRIGNEVHISSKDFVDFIWLE